MTVDDQSSNRSGNRTFEDILHARMSRRTMMAGGVATAAVAYFGPSMLAEAAGSGGPVSVGYFHPRRPPTGPLMDFAAAPNPGGPNPTISDDYKWEVLIPWGSPLRPGGPDIAGGRPASEAEALEQIGIGHDGMWYFSTGRNRGLLCINHEFGTNPHVLGKVDPESLEDVRISQAVHGMSVVAIKQGSRFGRWHTFSDRRSRRVTPNTPEVEFDGPAAGHPLLETAAGNPAAGTLNNCSNGFTPWGTYLTCEENFNGYFGASGDFANEERDRYGFTDVGFGYGWHHFDPRWDLSNPDYVNEENRWGWIFEIDPRKPRQKPIKHTAMGRFKHEGAALAEGKDGKIVAYMGDDQRFDYIYKYVSSDSWRRMRANGVNPLSDGSLYVARFNDDGTGDWLELTMDNPALAARFGDQGELVTFARIAADILGATPMDRPEWTSVAPNGDVYCTLTNNTRRTVADAANPLAPNPDGHIMRWRDSDHFVGDTFEWDIYLIAADTHGTEDEFGSPDGLHVDPDGRVFIMTDGGQPSGNNQLLVSDPNTGDLRRLFAGVTGDEITGLAMTPNRRTMFINTQHPGSGDPALSNFPVPGAGGPEVPRDATFVITRKDGGIIGS